MSIDERRAPVVIQDGNLGHDPANFDYPFEYKGHLESVVIPHEQIRNRTKDLAKLIHKDYGAERLLVICVLKGAGPFCHHLLGDLQELKHGFQTEYLRVKSYAGTSSSGNIEVSGGLDYNNLKDQHVLVVEDIVDTGTTLSHLLPVLKEKGSPRSIQVAALLEKRLSEPPKARAKYTGFTIPDHFIIGYGLDYNELYRDLQDIWVISKSGIKHGAEK